MQARPGEHEVGAQSVSPPAGLLSSGPPNTARCHAPPPPDEARRFDDRARLPCRGMAAPGRAGGRQSEHRALRCGGADRRARQARHGVPGRRGRHPRIRRAAGGALPVLQFVAVRADHPAGRAVDGDPAHRPGGDALHHLQRAVPCGAAVRFARSFERRPRRLERGHLGDADGGAELQLRDHAGLRQALRPRRGVRRGGARPVGLLGGRRLRARQDVGRIFRPGEAACAQPQGRALLGARPDQYPAHAAGLSRGGASRSIGPRPGHGCELRRRGVLRRGVARERAEILRLGERSHGEVWPLARHPAHHARDHGGGRKDRTGGAGQIRRVAGLDRSRRSGSRSLPPHSATFPATISTVRCRRTKSIHACAAARR